MKFNRDDKTIKSFGREWHDFDQTKIDKAELAVMFSKYFGVFPWDSLPRDAWGVDVGSGSGRWALQVAQRVHHLICIEPAREAYSISEKMLAQQPNVTIHNVDLDNAPISPNSLDFGYSLGVLHHIPDTPAALAKCVSLLKPGAPFLLYLYYSFENRPLWFRLLWKMSEGVRWFVSKLPEAAKKLITDFIAITVYWPLARLALLVERSGANPAALPLSFYRNSSLFTMRTDSRDRFGTPLEQRFSRAEITEMMLAAGLNDIKFSDQEPYWLAVGTKTA